MNIDGDPEIIVAANMVIMAVRIDDKGGPESVPIENLLYLSCLGPRVYDQAEPCLTRSQDVTVDLHGSNADSL